MKIAQIAPAIEQVPPLRYGGTELVVSNLTESLVERGHEVHLFASGDSQTKAELHPIVDKAIRNSCSVEEYPIMRDAAMHLSLQPILETLASGHFDIVHNHIGWRFLPYERVISGVMVSTLHGSLSGLFNQHVYQAFKKSRFISISNNQRRPLPDLNYIDTVYNGIDIGKFPYAAEPNKENPYVAFIGRITPLKGPKEAILAAKKARIPIKMAAKVDPVDQPYFEKEIKPLIDGKQVEFLGEVDHAGKVELLRGARALMALIQWEEPFGLFMVEALACGTPVIAIPRGSVREIIIDEVNGFHVGSVEEAAGAIQAIARLDRMAARKSAEFFSIKRMTDRYEANYRQVLQTNTAKRLAPLVSEFSSLSYQLRQGARLGTL